MPQDQKAPRRKKHRNSKLGCQTCKRRRVKCSESLPSCTNCVKHGSRCEYLDFNEAQLADFRKAKAAFEIREASRRLSSMDPAAQSMEKLSLGPVGGGQFSDSTLKSQVTVGGPGSPQSQNSAQPSFVDSHSLSYPGAVSASINDGGLHSHVSTRDILFASPSFSKSIEQTPSITTPYNVISPSTERPSFDSRWSSKDSMPHLYSSGVTQNFDNLLTEQDQQIIYPIYSFRNSIEPLWSYSSSSVIHNTHQEHENFSTTERDKRGRDDALGILPAAVHSSKSNKLSNATRSNMKFVVLSPEDMDFDARLRSCIINLGPLIAQGKAELPQIRDLYHAWLGHFIYKAYQSSIMFSCLINLTTNYLITNVFRGYQGRPHVQADDASQFRKTLLTHSIQHYASVIKSLRSLLNKNSDPQLASSVSYILSIMSIYDPEATVDSTVCFRDGMFSVLSYTIQLCKNKGCTPPLYVPTHMQLAANIVRTVYLPAYNEGFLSEYERMLERFGGVIGSIKETEVENTATFQFIVEAYEDLWKFCQESIRIHIPSVNNNLADIPFQLDVLFTMFRKWANLGPSRLLTVSKSTDPLEKVLNLFFRLFRKAVYAVVPQVKFCFLRDFDSPLMLDVFPSSCDASVHYSLDEPEKLCLTLKAYERILHELKLLSAYAIRVITFLNLRIAILYKNLVYNDKVRRLYPIDNIVDWKNSITDIHATRKEFQDRIGLREVSIENFGSTYISRTHYPRMFDPSFPSQVSPNDTTCTKVDLLSLQPNGLLKEDEPPLLL